MLLAAAFAVILSCQTVAWGRVGVFVGPRVVPFGWYGGRYGPGYYEPYAVIPNAGQVKLQTKVKDAQVFVNGSFAGTAGKLKTMWLRPGNYTIELRAQGLRYAESVYVVAGKKITLNPDLYPAPVQYFLRRADACLVDPRRVRSSPSRSPGSGWARRRRFGGRAETASRGACPRCGGGRTPQLGFLPDRARPPPEPARTGPHTNDPPKNRATRPAGPS